MIAREPLQWRVKSALRRNPVVALLGPRQCGKMTLAHQIVPPDSATYFDLEDPAVAQLMENATTVLPAFRA